MPKGAIKKYLCPECKTAYDTLAEARACSTHRTTDLFQAGDVVTSASEKAVHFFPVMTVEHVDADFLTMRPERHYRVMRGDTRHPQKRQSMAYPSRCVTFHGRHTWRKISNREIDRAVEALERRLRSARLLQKKVHAMNEGGGE